MRIAAFLPGLLLALAPSYGHHSFGAEFDEHKPLKLHGTVTKWELTNPHSWIHMDVKGDDGKVVNWAIETGAPNALYRQGWRKDDLKAGDTVTLEAFLAKDGSHTAAARSVKLLALPPSCQMIVPLSRLTFTSSMCRARRSAGCRPCRCEPR